MSIQSRSAEELQDDDWWVYTLPVEAGDDEFYGLAPQAIIGHVHNEEDRELVKEVNEDSITYRVLSRIEYDEDDPTQRRWDIEYGVEYSLDGALAREFLNVREPVSDPGSYAGSIASNIFPELERRTEKYYSWKEGENV